MGKTSIGLRHALLVGATAFFGMTVNTATQPAYAQQATRSYDIPAQDLDDALREFGRQTGRDVLFTPDAVANKRSPGVRGQLTEHDALQALLNGSGLRFEQTSSGGYAVQDPNSPTRLGADSDRTPNESDEEIVVVGTRIRGISSDFQPLHVYDKNDIDQTGATSIEDFARLLPENYSSAHSGALTDNGNEGGLTQNGGNIYGGSAFNIGGLGPVATLTLVNGHRISGGGSAGSFVDTSLIPLSAVERIEVMTDGASALYGSDAVAGVVNLVLRRDFNGAESNVSWSGTTRGGAEQYQLSQLLGRSWDSGELMAAVQYNDQRDLSARQRSFTPSSVGEVSLVPESTTTSAYVRGSQSFLFGTRLDGDLSYGKRDTASNFVSDSGFSISRSHQDSSVEQRGANLELSRELGGDWMARLSGLYSETLQAGDTETVTGTRVRRTSSFANLTLAEYSFVADGPLFQAPGGEARSAIGVSYRKNTFDNSRPAHRDRSVSSAFGELFIPLIGDSNATGWGRRLEVSLAGRYDDYDDFGSTFNPRLGLLWAPITDLRLRGTYSTSFRTANLIDLVPSPIPQFVIDLPDAGASDGVTTTLLLGGGNPNLGPEKSETYTFGFDLTPQAIPGFSMSASYFHTDYHDRIGLFPDEIYSPTGALIGPAIVFNPNLAEVQDIFNSPGVVDARATAPGPLTPSDIEAIWDSRVQNVASTQQSGLSANVSYRASSGLGDVSFSLDATYLFELTTRAFATSPEFHALDRIGQPADLRLRGVIGWERDESFGANLAVNYVNSYEHQFLSPPGEISSWTTLDLSVHYRVPTGPLSGVTAQLSIRNLTDEDPPFVAPNPPALLASHLRYDASNADPLGRVVAVSLRKQW